MSTEAYKHDRFAEILHHLRRGPVIISLGDWLVHIAQPMRINELARQAPFSISYLLKSDYSTDYHRVLLES